MTDKILCVKCGSLAQPIKRTMLSNKHKGYAIVCLSCSHIEYIHTDEYKALQLLPLEDRKILRHE